MVELSSILVRSSVHSCDLVYARSGLNLLLNEYLKQCYLKSEHLHSMIGYFIDFVVTDTQTVPLLYIDCFDEIL